MGLIKLKIWAFFLLGTLVTASYSGVDAGRTYADVNGTPGAVAHASHTNLFYFFKSNTAGTTPGIARTPEEQP